MKTKIEIFKNSQFGEIRTSVAESGEPLFCLADVCAAIGIKNHRDVKNRLDRDDVGQIDTIDSLGRIQPVTYVTESGLYDVIIRSDSESAKPFRRWVISEVLPAIRKTGGYIIAKEEDTPEIIMARAYLIATDTIERQNKVLAEKERQIKLKEEFIQLQAPKIDYYNQVLSSTNAHTLTTIAAMYRMSAITLNRILMIGKVIRKTGKEYSVTAKYQAEKIAELEKFPYVNSKGENCVKNDLRWTEKGHEVIDGIIKRAIAAGALKEVKGRYMIDHKWIKNLNTKQSCTK